MPPETSYSTPFLQGAAIQSQPCTSGEQPLIKESPLAFLLLSFLTQGGKGDTVLNYSTLIHLSAITTTDVSI